jgi:predicted signal transduction protein with EAL and GGDEF domain
MEHTATPSGATPAVNNPPWWKLPIVWMVIGGPAIVVVACAITVTIAYTRVDPVLDTSQGHVRSAEELPAHKARNHAADPTEIVKQSQ